MQLILLVCIIILGVGLAGVLRLWPRGKKFSFSQHVAQNRIAIVYYFILFSIVETLLTVYLVAWFAPTFLIHQLFIYFFIVSAVSQVACTIFPERGRWVVLHRWLAGMSGLFLIPALVVLLWANISLLAKSITLICLLVMCVCIVILVRDQKRRVPYALQIVYYAGFLLPIVWISYFE